MSVRPAVAVHRVAGRVAVRTPHGEPCPEKASLFSVFIRRGDQGAEGWKHRGDDGHQELEVAVQVCQVEVVLVQLDSSHGFEGYGDRGEATYCGYGPFL